MTEENERSVELEAKRAEAQHLVKSIKDFVDSHLETIKKGDSVAVDNGLNLLKSIEKAARCTIGGAIDD